MGGSMYCGIETAAESLDSMPAGGGDDGATCEDEEEMDEVVLAIDLDLDDDVDPTEFKMLELEVLSALLLCPFCPFASPGGTQGPPSTS